MAGGETIIRRATLGDIGSLRTLIAESARGLSADDYTPQQVEGALRGAFGVDTQLIRDGSYFVIEDGGRMAGCGGWSRRRTLFGSDTRADRDATELDPATEAAKIRAFFIHPEFARRGLGSRLLERCERDAIAHGFRAFELMATLPGVRLYAVRGYVGTTPVDWPLGDGLTIRFLPMRKAAPPFPFEIVAGVPGDAERILALQKRAYESEARLYDDWTIPPLTQTLESLREEVGRLRFVNALAGERLVGSVRARLDAETCHVGRLVVAPEFQGMGIGTQLMRRIEVEFPSAARFQLFTGHRSAGNLRLYERLGYRRLREQAVSPALTVVYLEKSR